MVFANGNYAAYFEPWFKRTDKQFEQHDYRGFEETQDRLARGFHEIETTMDDVGIKVVDEVDGKIDDMERKIDDIEGKIDDVETTLESRLDDTDQKMEYRFNAVDKKVGELKPKLIDIDSVMSNRLEKFQKKMDFHFDDARALSHKSLCT
ncbi:MAG: hypothetical protein Q9186_003724 [Xanthomendoza sp. 1 TL-2023]